MCYNYKKFMLFFIKVSVLNVKKNRNYFFVFLILFNKCMCKYV